MSRFKKSWGARTSCRLATRKSEREARLLGRGQERARGRPMPSSRVHDEEKDFAPLVHRFRDLGGRV